MENGTVFKLRVGTIIELGKGFVHTTLPDGRRVNAVPQPGSQLSLAESLGMTVDQLTMSHDPLHSILAVALGLPCSPALKAAADHAGWSEVTRREEEAVLALSAYVHALGLNVVQVAVEMGVLEHDDA